MHPQASETPTAIPERSTGALERAAAALGRVDQALQQNPLLPAFLYRARLDAVRRAAAVDGRAIDPWHLAAVLEGLRPRADAAARIIDRGSVFDAARHALELHGWIAAPDSNQESEIRAAEQALAAADGGSALLAGAFGCHAWLKQGGARPPMRAALIRLWTRRGLLRAPVPLTAPGALAAETAFEVDAWVPTFLDALAAEAAGYLRLLAEMERSWLSARAAVAGRRRNSRAAPAIDLLAAAPLVSATTLAAGLGMAVKNSIALLDGFLAEGIVVEVTHRAKRRLFGLAGLAPMREGVAPPRRPEPGRSPGRPPTLRDAVTMPPPPLPESPITPLDRASVDYSELEQFMAQADRAMRDTRRVLDALARSEMRTSDPLPRGAERPSEPAPPGSDCRVGGDA